MDLAGEKGGSPQARGAGLLQYPQLRRRLRLVRIQSQTPNTVTYEHLPLEIIARWQLI